MHDIIYKYHITRHNTQALQVSITSKNVTISPSVTCKKTKQEKNNENLPVIDWSERTLQH